MSGCRTDCRGGHACFVGLEQERLTELFFGKGRERPIPVQAVNVLLNLDYGCFLPRESRCVEIGCYQNANSEADVRVYADGEEKEITPPLKLGNDNRTIELRHLRTNGDVVRTGVIESASLRPSLTSLKALYGEYVGVDRARFDCILRLESGHVRPSLLKKRAFIETEEQPDGTMTPTGRWKELNPIAHNVIVHFELADGEVWELVSAGQVLLSTKDLAVRRRVEIDLAADDATGERVYRDAFKPGRRIYWFPDGCDEGPSGPYPPCRSD